MDPVEKILSGYQAVIRWSDEDEVYIVKFPSLRGCMAHGDTLDDAIMEGQIACRVFVKVAHESGIPVPPPLPQIEDIAHVAPIINTAELARRARMHPRTLASKIQRLTPLTASEAKSVDDALHEAGISLVS